MPLSSAIRLGPYEMVAPLGAAGMGEVVYREREARVVSSANHQHICVRHDVGALGRPT